MYVAGTLAPDEILWGRLFNDKVDAWCANWPSHELTEAYLAIDVEGDQTAKTLYRDSKMEKCSGKDCFHYV